MPIRRSSRSHGSGFAPFADRTRLVNAWFGSFLTDYVGERPRTWFSWTWASPASTTRRAAAAFPSTGTSPWTCGWAADLPDDRRRPRQQARNRRSSPTSFSASARSDLHAPSSPASCGSARRPRSRAPCAWRASSPARFPISIVTGGSILPPEPSRRFGSPSNRELEQLEEGLAEAIRVLAPGGRIGVITFHSLEDRIVKSSSVRKAGSVRAPRNGRSVNVGGKRSCAWSRASRVTASEEEVSRNPASRSAKLRVAEKPRPRLGDAGRAAFGRAQAPSGAEEDT